jgi:DNA-binding HxlR family transcriptional regulator
MTLQSPVPVCPADIIVNIVRGKWALNILLVIGEQGEPHFNAIRRTIPGISAKVLGEQLGYLIDGGVLQRTHTASARHEVVYSYTEHGKELRTVLDDLHKLALRWQSSENPLENDTPLP